MAVVVESVRLFGQALTSDLLSEANRAARILREIRAEILADAGPQRFIGHPDLDSILSPSGRFKVEWEAEDRDFLDENADLVIRAIAATTGNTPTSVLPALRAKSAVPTTGLAFTQIDALAAQIENLLAEFDTNVLNRPTTSKGRLGLIVGGILLGTLALGSMVYFARRDRR